MMSAHRNYQDRPEHSHPAMNRADSKPIRVALFHPCLIHGGIPRVFANLARGFLEHGLTVDMVQATAEGGFRDQVPAGVRLVDLNASRALTSVFPLVRYLRRERPDALISGAIQTNIAAVWAKRLARVPTRLILTEHNNISAIVAHARMFRTRVTPFFVRRFYPWAEELVAVSQGAAEDLALLLGIPADVVHVIHNPIVGPEFWRRAAEPLADKTFAADPRPVILAVGRMHYHKDYPTLLQAIAIVRRTTNARLVFLGDGEERGNLVALVRQLDLESCVSFLGDVPNPLPYMKRAAALALSSVEEALPTVLIESLAVGLPVVATDCPSGPREILRDGAYGTLVPVGDSAALAEALLRVLQHPRRPSIPDEALAPFRHDHVIGKYLAILGVNGNTQHPSSLQAGVATEER
jgi:glycosyltransferase involved in cell wall biosynthesis